MPCYHPIPAWESRQLASTRRFGITFRKAEAYTDRPVDLPCGKCIGCRIRRANEWGTRVMNELKDAGLSSFVTLTYDDQHLPPGASLNKDDLQRFWKRLRKAGHTIRYFACGEYGETTNRPHYHAVVLGYWPSHRVQLPGNRNIPLYRSPELEKLWPLGHSSFSPVTRENATYVAKYTLGKYDEKGQPRDFGERLPPYLTMSTHPGIGHNYARDNARALAHHDGIRLRGGSLAALPRYYDKVLDRHDPHLARGLKTRRKEKAADRGDVTLDQLRDEPSLTSKETNANARQQLNRNQL